MQESYLTIKRESDTPLIIYEASNNGFGYFPNFEQYDFIVTAGTIGVLAADQLCNHDPNKPIDIDPNKPAYYKALLGSIRENTTRRSVCWMLGDETICGGLALYDWPLYPGTTYFRADRVTPIGTTNNIGIFDTNILLSNSITLPQDPPNQPLGTWTGLINTWAASALSCAEWTGNGEEGDYILDNGRTGSAWSVEVITAINTHTALCTEQHSIYCVAQ